MPKSPLKGFSESERHKILDWFSPLNFFKTQQDVFKKRQEDTGRWFLDLQHFQDWLTGPTHTLCCVGIRKSSKQSPSCPIMLKATAGAGKSVLASIVVDHLRNDYQQDHRGAGRSVGVAVVYCNFKEIKTQSTENLLAGLGRQMIDDMPIPETLRKLHESHRKKQTR